MSLSLLAGTLKAIGHFGCACAAYRWRFSHRRFLAREIFLVDGFALHKWAFYVLKHYTWRVSTACTSYLVLRAAQILPKLLGWPLKSYWPPWTLDTRIQLMEKLFLHAQYFLHSLGRPGNTVDLLGYVSKAYGRLLAHARLGELTVYG